MRNICYPLCWVAGVVAVHGLRDLPSQTERWLFAVLTLSLAAGLMIKSKWQRTTPVTRVERLSQPLSSLFSALLISLLCFSAAASYTVWRADLRLSDHLDPTQDNKVTRVPLLVAELPEQVEGGVRFIGQIEPFEQSDQFPQRVLVDWPGACTGDCPVMAKGRGVTVEPGQRWRMALRFRQPHGRLNPHGFDSVGWLFEKGIRATATVRGDPERLADTAGFVPGLWIERLRAQIRTRMRRLLSGKVEAPVMIALSIGDQQGVSAADWQVFNTTGITHLVSISGSHVTLIAALGAAILMRLYRRLRWRTRLWCEHLPSRLVFVWSAVVVAFFYCLLAGWGVPAQRTFFMLVCAAAGLSGRLPLTGHQAVALAAAAMTLLDPWAVMSTGFWLSFAAVATLIVVSEQTPRRSGSSSQQTIQQSRAARLWTALTLATHLQVVMTMATTPVLAFLFQQVSFASLAANAWAIPWVTFIATPLALLLSAATLLPVSDVWLSPLAWLAHESLYWSLWPVRWLASFEWMAIDVSAMPVGWLALGLVGVLASLMLPPSGWRWSGYLLMLPGLLYRPSEPAHGAWQLTVLDVGQGGAALLRTKSQTLLFDTGWRFGEVDAADRVIVPVLRAQGVTHLDRVIISHADNDHIGGLATLQAKKSIGLLMGAGVPSAQACRRGQQWQVDGVRFAFLHPQDDCAGDSLKGVLRNRCSCVLQITGRWHSAWLTGDIDEVAEHQLAAASDDLDPDLTLGGSVVDVITMPHHGSRTGSSAALVNLVRARHAVAQAGQHNRFGHPHAEVMSRWHQSGTQTWISSRDGAMIFESAPSGLRAISVAQQRQRYWHAQVTRAPFNGIN